MMKRVPILLLAQLHPIVLLPAVMVPVTCFTVIDAWVAAFSVLDPVDFWVNMESSITELEHLLIVCLIVSLWHAVFNALWAELWLLTPEHVYATCTLPLSNWLTVSMLTCDLEFDAHDDWTWEVRALAMVLIWAVSAVLSAFAKVIMPCTVLESVDEQLCESTEAVFVVVDDEDTGGCVDCAAFFVVVDVWVAAVFVVVDVWMAAFCVVVTTDFGAAPEPVLLELEHLLTVWLIASLWHAVFNALWAEVWLLTPEQVYATSKSPLFNCVTVLTLTCDLEFDAHDDWTWEVRVLAMVSVWAVSAVLSVFAKVMVPCIVALLVDEQVWEVSDGIALDARKKVKHNTTFCS